MRDGADARSFGYRSSARYPFPKMVKIEIPQGVSSWVIGTHGIDIRGNGIAIATDVPFDPTEPAPAQE